MSEMRKNFVTSESIVARIDNDFNPDNSDWIPRVNVWIYDALAQLDIVNSVRVRKSFPVDGRIAVLPCDFSKSSIRVFDDKGCPIEAQGSSLSACCASTGEEIRSASDSASAAVKNDKTHTTGINYNSANNANGDVFAIPTGKGRFDFAYSTAGKSTEKHNYVMIGCDKISLNFDTKFITIEFDNMISEYSDTYGCNLPLIPNIGIVIECIVNYCMYKMLCRGYKHPVMNLSASQYGTNPYYFWIKNKSKAKRAVINKGVNESMNDSDIWRSNFYIQTFNPRR